MWRRAKRLRGCLGFKLQRARAWATFCDQMSFLTFLNLSFYISDEAE